MFVKTVKIKSILKALLTVLVIAAVIFAAVYAINRVLKPKDIVMTSEQEMLNFLHDLGWETSESAINIREVTIPAEWNEVYAKYNDLQLQQGFDLEDYKGASATVYSFRILNYDGRPDNMVANLLICDGVLVGGDISCTELGGFMQGLAKQTAPQEQKS